MDEKTTQARNSIMQMARGAFQERVDYEMTRVIDNILDVNTKVTLTITLAPDEERQQIGVAVQAKATLAAVKPASTSLWVTSDGNGDMAVVEMVPEVPGQMQMSGPAQEEPKLLKLVKNA